MTVRNFRPGRIGIALAALWGCISTSCAWADTIVMTNGDQLSGDLLLMDGGTLVLKTEYAGEIRISWDKIAQLQTDDPMLLRAKGLPAGYEARITSSGQLGGSVALQPKDAIQGHAPEQMALADIERIVRPHAFLRDWSFKGGIDLSIGATHSSKSNQNWSAILHTTARRDWWRYGLKLDYARKAQNGVIGTYNYNASYTVDRFLSEKFFLRGRMRYGRDRVENPAHQYVLAAGPGYQFWDDGLGALSVSAFLTHTRYKYLDRTRDNFQTAGLGWNFTHYLGGKQWQLFANGEIHRAFRGASDYSFETALGIRYSVTQWMSLYAKTGYDHITMSGKPSTDERRYLVGLGLTW